MNNRFSSDEEVLARLVREAGDPSVSPDPQFAETLRATILDRVGLSETVAQVTEGIRKADLIPITVERNRHAQPETTRPTFLTRSLTNWKWIFRHPVSSATAAAIFILAVVGVALWFHSSGTTPAFADFLQPILEAKTVKYKVTTKWTSLSAEMKSLPAEMQKNLMKGLTSEVMMPDAHRMRTESENPDKSKMVTIWDESQGKTLSLLPAQKRATVSKNANNPKDKTPNGGDPVAGWRSLLLDARDKPDVKRESLGEKDIDGRRVVGFRISLPTADFRVWGDPKTGLPARIEMTTAIMPNIKFTMSDFEFNVDMDESLFSVEPPAGYEVGSFFIETPIIDGSTTEEKDLIETFREYSRLSGGPFPALLDMEAITGIIFMEFTSDRLQEPGAEQELAETQAKLQPGLMFSVLLPKEADSHYAGKGVSLGAPDTPIFWYRPKDAKTYRVIYADLSVRDADTPPDMPVAHPEQDLIETFRYYSELSGGPFPNSLDLVSLLQGVSMKVYMLPEDGQKRSAKQMQEITKTALMKLQPGLTFVVSLSPEADSHYAGKGVSLGAPDMPIFWYRPKDAKTYRVIYADLSVRDADTPPSVPVVQPEQDLIDTFHEYSEVSGGAFPDSLDLQTMAEMIGREFTIQMFLELAPGKGKLNEEQRHKIEELIHKTVDLQKLAPEKGKPNKEQMDKIEEQMLNLVDWEKLAPGKGKPNKEQMIKIMEAETQKFMKAQMLKITVATMKFQPGLNFTGSLPPEADAHYAGKGVSLGAADTPIFWYRPKDAKTYRVIYADLSVKDMAPDDVKKLPEANAK